jgi:hypothetical protein
LRCHVAAACRELDTSDVFRRWDVAGVEFTARTKDPQIGTHLEPDSKVWLADIGGAALW